MGNIFREAHIISPDGQGSMEAGRVSVRVEASGREVLTRASLAALKMEQRRAGFNFEGHVSWMGANGLWQRHDL